MKTLTMSAVTRALALHFTSIGVLLLGHAHAQETSPLTRQYTGEAGSWQRLTVDIPEQTDSLSVVLSGDNGDADLYLRFAEEPNATAFDCRPFLDGSAEVCTVAMPRAGTWHIGVNAFTAYTDATLTVSWAASKGMVTPAQPANPPQQGGTLKEAVEGAAGSWQRFTVDVPAGMSSLRVTLTGATGDADLYLRFGDAPSEAAFDCRPYLDGVDEICTIANPTPGTWHLGVNAFTAYTGGTLEATWTSGAQTPAEQPAETPPTTPPAGDWKANVLSKHNELRANHCAAPLTWDDELANAAQAYADSCVWGHDPNANAGENLAGGSEQPTEMWYSEVAQYDFANPGFSMSTGHFTQVVWRNSTNLGCGRAMCSFGVYYVCRYSPSGNFTGQYAENVLPAGATCP